MPLAPPKPRAVAPWPAAKTIYKVGGDVQAPVLVSRTEPKIPIRAHCRGLVAIQCVIDERGNVTQARDVTSQPNSFTQAFADAAQNWKFKPAMLHGSPVAVEYSLTLNIRCN